MLTQQLVMARRYTDSSYAARRCRDKHLQGWITLQRELPGLAISQQARQYLYRQLQGHIREIITIRGGGDTHNMVLNGESLLDFQIQYLHFYVTFTVSMHSKKETYQCQQWYIRGQSALEYFHPPYIG